MILKSSIMVLSYFIPDYNGNIDIITIDMLPKNANSKLMPRC